ncbi:MAG: HlyD family efflux transporter periplasmic adaptor subunit [Alphaproteobacteria bacterium]|nr:HlyD family efflux transporter periplasmic adaptor subunit [Alphaproteobacteria bacterium]
MERRQLLYIALVVLILGAAFAWAFREPPVPVDLAVIGTGDIEVTVSEEGVTRIREVFTISAPVAGRTLRAPLDEGDMVVRNETVVAMIEPQIPSFLDFRLRREAQAAEKAAAANLDLARADLVRAQAERRFWETEFNRNQALRESDTISERKLEQTRMELDIRIAAVDQAGARVEVARQELARAQALTLEPDEELANAQSPCCLHLRSPVSGRVLDVIVESQQVVASGTPLLTVGDPKDLEIVVDLLSAEAVKVEAGALARIDRWGGEGLLDARVRKIEPTGYTKVSALGIDEQRVDVILDIESPPEAWRELGHDYRVFADITILRREGVIRLPMGAIFREGRDWAVFIVEDQRAVLRRIEIGARNSDMAEVVSGLSPGDRVILHASDRIADGVRITERDG